MNSLNYICNMYKLINWYISKTMVLCLNENDKDFKTFLFVCEENLI